MYIGKNININTQANVRKKQFKMENKAQKTIDQANTHNNNNRTDKNLCSLPIYQKTTHPGQVPKRQRTKQAMTHTHTHTQNTKTRNDH